MAIILYFGNLPDRVGRAREEFFLPKTAPDVAGLLTYLRARGPAWADALQDDRLTVTVNKKFVDLGTAISDEDEIAIVSKGLGR